MTNKLRLHVVSLPHTNTAKAFSACAYTEKVRKFCVMMKALGHTVYLYAGSYNEAPCDEHIPCITEELRAVAAGHGHYTSADFNPNQVHWFIFNTNVAQAIRARMQGGDFICVIGGWAHKLIADLIPELKTVEFGIGYGGIFAKFKVFESYAWQHMNYGKMNYHNIHAADGTTCDTVIPNYFEVEDFPFGEGKGDDKGEYFLFLGRKVSRKGLQIAADTCAAIGARLIIAGPEGDCHPEYGEHLGVVGPEERGKLLSNAKALFAPTTYIEPFGGAVVEAMLCGTPVITTDWGAFTETVIDDVTGFRCSLSKDFTEAAETVGILNRYFIRESAQDLYSLEAVGPKYERYFERISEIS